MCAVPQRQQMHHKGISHMLVYRTATSTKVGVFLQRCSLDFSLNLPHCNVFNAISFFFYTFREVQLGPRDRFVDSLARKHHTKCKNLTLSKPPSHQFWLQSWENVCLCFFSSHNCANEGGTPPLLSLAAAEFGSSLLSWVVPIFTE